MSLTLSQNTTRSFETLLASERARLVHLCMRLTDNPDAAQDLAQETLLEAWRNLYKFHGDQAENWSKWLTAIARNVCKRWMQEHNQHTIHVATLPTTADDSDSLEGLLSDTESIEIELEREELAHLLDQALGLLPPSVRDVLIERYINELSHREISERLGLSEDALVQRLYRGKQALRRVLSTQLRTEATAMGLPTAIDIQAQGTTHIYCPLCGKEQLIKYEISVDSLTGFRCPGCGNIAAWKNENQPLKSFKSLLNRQISHLGDRYWEAINGSQVHCSKCGRPAQFTVCYPQDISHIDSAAHYTATSFSCPHCGQVETNDLPRLTLDICEARRFWRKHAHMQWLPERIIDFAGRPALVSSFRSRTDTVQLDVIIDQATLKVLGVHEC